MSGISLKVNGRTATLPEVLGGERLLDTLRYRMGLKGTKEGCRSGECGACTVLVDGTSTLSCLVLTAELPGASVETIESIGDGPIGRRVVAAFSEEPALQCGYCTPGFVVALVGLVRESDGAPLDAETIRQGLSGNLCRCTGYGSISRAIDRLASGDP